MKSLGVGGHTKPYRGDTDNWITPKHIFEALGEFDLDPCACCPQPWPTAKKSYNIHDDGFNQPWEGRVFLNPPYGPETGKWLEKLKKHGDGIALIFARTDTAMFFEQVWRSADGAFFLQGRLHFHFPDGTRAKHNSGGPSVLIAYGIDNYFALKYSNLEGFLINLNTC